MTIGTFLVTGLHAIYPCAQVKICLLLNHVINAHFCGYMLSGGSVKLAPPYITEFGPNTLNLLIFAASKFCKVQPFGIS